MKQIILALNDIGQKILDYLPTLFAALLILIIGWIIALILAGIVKRIVVSIKIDKILEKVGIKKIFETAGYKFEISDVFHWMVKWFLIIVVLVATFDMLKIPQISAFLKQVVLYIPNIFVAIVILLIGLIVAEFVSNTIKGAVQAARLKGEKLLATTAKWAILIFCVLAALNQLGVAEELIRILFVGFVGMFAIAGGVAFGLGGKEMAAELLQEIRKTVREK